MPVVTKIVETRRDPRRRSIHLDGSFAFAANVTVVARFRLREGMTLSAEQVEAVLAGGVRQAALDHGLRLVAGRAHAREELRRKLMRRDYGAAVVDWVLGELARLGYLDDLKYATARATAAAKVKAKGRGRAYVELLKAGVARETARRATQEVYESHDSLAAARDLARRKAPSLARLDAVTARRRLTGVLARRGYDFDVIRPVLDEVLGRGNDMADDS